MGGAVLAESHSAREAVAEAVKDAWPSALRERVSEQVLPDGRSFRYLTQLRDGWDGTPLLVTAAIDRTHEENMLRRYRITVVVVLTAALLACGFCGWQIASFGLRPLNEIVRAARDVGPSTLNRRISTATLPRELSDLADTFNEMLARLEASFEQLSRFSADIAHELRSPINSLRGEAEVTLSRARTADEYRDALASCLEDCDRLTRMIESLLFVARAESPNLKLRRETVHVQDELAAIGEFFEPLAQKSGVTLTTEASPDLVFALDRTLFQRAISNLLANAIAYTPPGGKADVRASAENGCLQINVSDTGCGIAQEHVLHVFDRLYRADNARSEATGGLGLGLAIVKSVAELHGGSVAIQSEVGRGTRITLTFGPGSLP
jgi:two-component system heavy metal sensor histidine kinase CusS